MPKKGKHQSIKIVRDGKTFYKCPFCGYETDEPVKIALHMRWCRKKREEESEEVTSPLIEGEPPKEGEELSTGNTGSERGDNLDSLEQVEAQTYEVEEDTSEGIVFDDKLARLERILKDALPRTKRKTIKYILDMFRMNEFYQTPSGLYHLLTTFKLDPATIKIIIDYVFGPGAFTNVQQSLGMFNPASMQSHGVQHQFMAPSAPQMMYMMTPFGPMPIIINVPSQTQTVRRRRPLIDPKTGDYVRDKDGNIVFEEVEEPVTASPYPMMGMFGPSQFAELIRAIREYTSSEVEKWMRIAESYKNELENLRSKMIDVVIDTSKQVMDIKLKAELDKLDFIKKAMDDVNRMKEEMMKRELEWQRQRYEDMINRLINEHKREIESLRSSFTHLIEDLKKDLEYAEKLRRLRESMTTSDFVRKKTIEMIDEGIRGIREDLKDLKEVLKEYITMQIRERSARIPSVSKEEKESIIKKLREAMKRAGGEEKKEEKRTESEEKTGESRPVIVG